MTADEWNRAYPVGTQVIYYPTAFDHTTARATRTRSEAWTLGHGEAVVKVEGTTGCVSLRHLDLGEPRVTPESGQQNEPVDNAALNEDELIADVRRFRNLGIFGAPENAQYANLLDRVVARLAGGQSVTQAFNPLAHLPGEYELGRLIREACDFDADKERMYLVVSVGELAQQIARWLSANVSGEKKCSTA